MTTLATFQPSEAQRWNIFAGFAAAMDSRAARAELRGWCGLALLSLGIAGIFAFMVAISRVPGADKLAPLPDSFFGKGLVVHVIFSFVVWYLSILGALTVVAAYRLGGGSPPGPRLGRVAIVCGYSAAAMLFFPGFFSNLS